MPPSFAASNAASKRLKYAPSALCGCACAFFGEEAVTGARAGGALVGGGRPLAMAASRAKWPLLFSVSVSVIGAACASPVAAGLRRILGVMVP